ncbi:MAG: FAD-dependent oxidoreductase [Thermodesulfobacteriota bacterium]
MWKGYKRDNYLQGLDREFDVIVVGGGITGAGILREASRMGLKTCLLEKRDFAWGTSSWSSKMVHGGLRYLKQGDIKLTLESVRERKRLLNEAPQMIRPLEFLIPVYNGHALQKYIMQAGLFLYDLLALQWKHKSCSANNLLHKLPGLEEKGLLQGISFQDALTDDSRLVMAVISQSIDDGAIPLNYCSVEDVIYEKDRIAGVRALDRENNRYLEIRGRVVINATGVWGDQVCQKAGGRLPLRPLRGSHFVVSRDSLDVPCAVTFFHPEDKRPIFAFPWNGVTVVGTTDLDHVHDLNNPPGMSRREFEYLQYGIKQFFPRAEISENNLISSFSGIRPVVKTNKRNPSKEPRKHVIRDNQGMITVTGGKLTTFRLIARDTLKTARKYLGELPGLKDNPAMFNIPEMRPPHGNKLSGKECNRLVGRYGPDTTSFLEQANPDELEFIENTNTLWAEIRWCLRHEAVNHLEDLLLRRTRLGILLPQGGSSVLEPVLDICRQELGWDKERAEREKTAYLQLWEDYYSPDFDNRQD